MLPNDYQNHSSDPVSLPAVPVATQPQPPVSSLTGNSKQPPGASDTTARVVAQTKQLILQYGNDPYKLSEALSQLKSAYLAEQYHIMASQAEK